MKVVEDGYAYEVKDFTGGGTQFVHFNKRNPDGSYIDGTTIEEIIKVLIHKLYHFQSISRSPENHLAITYLKQIEDLMQARLNKKKVFVKEIHDNK